MLLQQLRAGLQGLWLLPLLAPPLWPTGPTGWAKLPQQAQRAPHTLQPNFIVDWDAGLTPGRQTGSRSRKEPTAASPGRKVSESLAEAAAAEYCRQSGARPDGGLIKADQLLCQLQA